MDTSTTIAYEPLVAGSQHGHAYYESVGKYDGSLIYCSARYITRFFDNAPRSKDVFVLAVSICEKDWKKYDHQQEIAETLNSFRLIE